MNALDLMLCGGAFALAAFFCGWRLARRKRSGGGCHGGGGAVKSCAGCQSALAPTERRP